METAEKTAFNLLKNLGLNQLETKIYLYLSKTKPQKASIIAKSNKVKRVQLYKILKTLQLKQIIESTNTYPKLYSAVPLDKVFDLSIKSKQKQVQKLQLNKKSILSQWQGQIPKNSKSSKESFMVIEGTTFVNAKMRQMAKNLKESICVVSTYSGAIQAYQAGVFEEAFLLPNKADVKIRFLLSLDVDEVDWFLINEMFSRSVDAGFGVEVHLADLGAINFPRFMIVDGCEVIFSLHTTSVKPLSVEEDTGFWTNNLVLVSAFVAFFDGLWASSRPIVG